MNVWIVYAPDVVTVPPVDDVDTPSLPSVLYEMITTPSHHFHDALAQYDPPPHPHNPFVPATQAPAHCAQFPHHPDHQVPLVTDPAPPHHPQYVTDVPDILFAVPLPPFVPTVFVVIFHPAVEEPHHPAPQES